MEGFRSELQTRIRGTSSDLKVESTNYIGLREPDKVAAIIEKIPGVTATAQVTTWGPTGASSIRTAPANTDPRSTGRLARQLRAILGSNRSRSRRAR